jgi:hypothetical protein
VTEIKDAIITFSQSEKIKAGLIWASQALELLRDLPDPQSQGENRSIKLLIDMMMNEVLLAKKLSSEPAWDEIRGLLEQAIVMMNSGVAPESVRHLTMALSIVTNIGHRSMTLLRQKGLV